MLVEGFGGGSPAEGFAGSGVEGERDGVETVIGLYKTELIRGPTGGPWRSVDDVELATLGWVHWHNHQRLHSHLGDTPPAEFEEAYAARQADHALVGNQ